MLGLSKGEVLLSPWTSQWEKVFLREKERIQTVPGHYAAEVHHIGSTAVKNLSAKPIIDIAVEVTAFDHGTITAPILEELGYSYKGTNILPDRHYFSKGEPRTHQIHMYQTGSRYLLEQLHFRDCLRKNDKVRIEYEKLKQKLAVQHKRNKHRYAGEKTEFVRNVLICCNETT
jgi:GrpB-like predicted nucleotidyltransferase (UPF0157 family)